MSHQQYLFRELPLDSIFAFESPDNPKKFKKISKTHAVSGNSPVPLTVSPNILVFPVHPFSLVTPKQAEQIYAVVPTYWEEDQDGDYVEEELG